MSETARQRFLRNHGERIRIMRLAEKRARDAGDDQRADFIALMADRWESIGKIAEQEEGTNA